jgi:hypothetical protein
MEEAVEEAAEGRAFEPITNIDKRIATVISGAIEGRLAHTMTVVFAKQAPRFMGWHGSNLAFARQCPRLARGSVCLRLVVLGK